MKKTLKIEALNRANTLLAILRSYEKKLETTKFDLQNEIEELEAHILKLKGLKTFNVYDATGCRINQVVAKDRKRALILAKKDAMNSGSYIEFPISVRLK